MSINIGLDVIGQYTAGLHFAGLQPGTNYSVQINGGGEGAGTTFTTESPPPPEPPPLVAPANFRASIIGLDSIRFECDPVAGAAQYRLRFLMEGQSNYADMDAPSPLWDLPMLPNMHVVAYAYPVDADGNEGPMATTQDNPAVNQLDKWTRIPKPIILEVTAGAHNLYVSMHPDGPQPKPSGSFWTTIKNRETGQVYTEASAVGPFSGLPQNTPLVVEVQIQDGANTTEQRGPADSQNADTGDNV